MGGAVGGLFGGGDVNVDIPTAQMNSMLQGALSNALGYSENYTNQAIGTQEEYLKQALNQLQQGTQALQQNFNQSQALQQPYRDMGYRASDMYADSLGVARAEMGSQALSSILNKDAQVQGQLFNLQNAGNAYNQLTGQPLGQVGSSLNAPTLEMLRNNLSEEQLRQYIKDNSAEVRNIHGDYFGNSVYSGRGAQEYAAAGGPQSYNPDDAGAYRNIADTLGNLMNNQVIQGYAKDALAEPLLKQAQQAYDLYGQSSGALNNYLGGQYGAQQQNVANAYNRGLFSTPTGRTALY